MQDDASVRAEITETFGDAVYTDDGALNRAVLAEQVFGDADRLEQLNAIVHPRVFEAFEGAKERAAEEEIDLLVHEAALLFRGGGRRARRRDGRRGGAQGKPRGPGGRARRRRPRKGAGPHGTPAPAGRAPPPRRPRPRKRRLAGGPPPEERRAVLDGRRIVTVHPDPDGSGERSGSPRPLPARGRRRKPTGKQAGNGGMPCRRRFSSLRVEKRTSRGSNPAIEVYENLFPATCNPSRGRLDYGILVDTHCLRFLSGIKGLCSSSGAWERGAVGTSPLLSTPKHSGMSLDTHRRFTETPTNGSSSFLSRVALPSLRDACMMGMLRFVVPSCCRCSRPSTRCC